MVYQGMEVQIKIIRIKPSFLKKNPKLLFLLKGYIFLFNGLAHVCFLVIFHIYLKINLVLPVTKTLELKIIRMPILFLGASSKPYFK